MDRRLTDTFHTEHRVLARALGYSNAESLRRKVLGAWTTKGLLVEGTDYVLNPVGMDLSNGPVLLLSSSGVHTVHNLAFGGKYKIDKTPLERAESQELPDNSLNAPPADTSSPSDEDAGLILEVADRFSNLIGQSPKDIAFKATCSILLHLLPLPLQGQVRSDLGLDEPGPQEKAPDPDPSQFMRNLRP